MEIRRTQNTSKVSSDGGVKGASLSPSSLTMSFIFGLFRKKDREKDKDKDKERTFTREEQILSGIIASDELIDGLSKGTDPNNSHGH